MLMKGPVFHNVKEALMHQFTLASMTEIWSPMQICPPTFLSTFHMIARIAPVTQNHVLVVRFPPTELARTGISWRPLKGGRRLLQEHINQVQMLSLIGIKS